jgi:hypothetical protein
MADLMDRGPGKRVARAPVLGDLVIESREPPILNEPVSLAARHLGHSVTKGPVWSYPRPELADNYGDEPPRAA